MCFWYVIINCIFVENFIYKGFFSCIKCDFFYNVDVFVLIFVNKIENDWVYYIDF